MKQIKINFSVVILVFILFLFSCNDKGSTSQTNGSDTTSVATNADTSAMPPYDPAMDPYNIGGTAIAKLGDTLGVKMYEFTAKPGDSAALHSHPDHAVYVLQGGKLAVTFKGVGRQIMDLKTVTGFISGALSDAGKNIGNTTVKLLIVDIHRPRVK